MSSIEDVLRRSLEKILPSVNAPQLRTISAETDLFESLDSLAVVDMLLEAEMQLEFLTGRYVTLADEAIFDATRSPLRSWGTWVAYVESRHSD